MRRSRRCVWGLLGVVHSILPSANGRAVLTFPDLNVNYGAQIADFGHQFNDKFDHTASLMLPPTDETHLCSFPSSFEKLNRSDFVDYTSPIALLVSRGECSMDQKAQVALALHTNLTDEIRYVIVHNNDVNTPNDLAVMSSTTQGKARNELEDLGFIFISTGSGSSIYDLIWEQAKKVPSRPNFAPQNSEWNLPVLIEQQYGRPQSPSSPSTYPSFFFVLRFILFGLLITSPCLRAAYLWFKGGGRITFRRSDRGRIVGLQYVHPMPYWFAPDVPRLRREHEVDHTEKLTEDDFLALPEITYEPARDGESSQSKNTEDEQVLRGETENVGLSQDQTLNESAHARESIDVYTTSCTTCSICIDDFEPGERIRVLPRCLHAFHTDCIKPWLTERQGCCPLCKTKVVQTEETSEGARTETATEEQSDLPA